jgi:Holliday junction DNA helicase RuvB
MKSKATAIAKDFLNFDNYVGQSKVIDKVSIFTNSCVESDEALPHMLFNGPGGLGKTSMAYIIAKQMGRNFVQTIGHNIHTSTDVYYLFKEAFKDNCAYPIIFIDEIHLIPTKIQQLFYTAMEDLRFTAKNVGGYMMNYTIAPFTLIGATTNLEKLQGPFISRFVLQFEFVYYTMSESAQIAYNYFQDNPIGNMDDEIIIEAAKEIAVRARGVARNVINMCYQVKHFVLSNTMKYETYCKEAAERYFEVFEVDESGLIDVDLLYLEALYASLPSPVGVEYLSALLDREPIYIKSRIEPWLLTLGYVRRTKVGRVITSEGIKALERSGRISPDSNFRSSIG